MFSVLLTLISVPFNLFVFLTHLFFRFANFVWCLCTFVIIGALANVC